MTLETEKGFIRAPITKSATVNIPINRRYYGFGFGEKTFKTAQELSDYLGLEVMFGGTLHKPKAKK